MHSSDEDALPILDNLPEQPVDEELLDCLATEARDLPFDDQLFEKSTLAATSTPTSSTLAETSTQAPLAPSSGRGAGGEGLAHTTIAADSKANAVPADANSQKPSKRPLFAMLGCFLLAFACLAPRLANFASSSPAVAANSVSSAPAKAPASRLITKPIEEIRCGDRIPSQLPDGLLPEDEPEPDPATWRLVELTVEKKDGAIVEVNLLRPLAWLEQAGAIQNGHFDIAVEELDIDGTAALLDVKPCPPIQSGDGQVVTGTFRHTCDDLVELHIEGEPEPIVCTSGHPIWNAGRKEFAAAADFASGDQTSTLNNGVRKVVSVRTLRETTSVYNIEVNSTHVYFVGTFAHLVHNALLEDCTKRAKRDVQQNGGKHVRVQDKMDTSRGDINPGDQNYKIGKLPGETDGKGTVYFYHDMVERDGKFFDELHPEGIDRDDWVAKFIGLNPDFKGDVTNFYNWIDILPVSE